jgi:hypothetical protein
MMFYIDQSKQGQLNPLYIDKEKRVPATLQEEGD